MKPGLGSRAAKDLGNKKKPPTATASNAPSSSTRRLTVLFNLFNGSLPRAILETAAKPANSSTALAADTIDAAE
jgi:hypothetical protein